MTGKVCWLCDCNFYSYSKEAVQKKTTSLCFPQQNNCTLKYSVYIQEIKGDYSCVFKYFSDIFVCDYSTSNTVQVPSAPSPFLRSYVSNWEIQEDLEWRSNRKGIWLWRVNRPCFIIYEKILFIFMLEQDMTWHFYFAKCFYMFSDAIFNSFVFISYIRYISCFRQKYFLGIFLTYKIIK